LQQELVAAKEEFLSAEEAHSFAEQLLADTEADLAANKRQQSNLEQVITNLQEDAPQQSIRSPTCIGDMLAGRSRFKRNRPASDIVFTKTNLSKGKWWRGCERYKIPGSPSRITSLSKSYGMLEAW
jgi:hypothetical protein